MVNNLDGALVLITGAGSGIGQATALAFASERARVLCPIVTSTCYVGSRGAADVRARTERIFRRGHPPELVGRAVVDAVRRDRAVVPVGWEAKLGWGLHRLLPVSLQQAAARLKFP